MLVSALVTPWCDGVERIDLVRLQRLVSFQLEHGASQVLLAGTTGEGAALDDGERAQLIDAALQVARPEQVMVSIGGGRLAQVIEHGRAALSRGVRDLLLADCPYSGASSGALRTGWHGAAAAALPDARLFPYAVPGRTATEMLPDDLARLVRDHPNVVGVKDATGRLARMVRVRELCGDEFLVLCGDDHLMGQALVDPNIRADGAVSFAANLAPAMIGRLVDAGLSADAAAVRALHRRLELLFRLVAVTTDETMELDGAPLSVPQRARNPVPVKAALQLLGVMDGACRAPLGPLGPVGLSRVRSALHLTRRRHPEVLEDLAEFFDVDPTAALEVPVEPRRRRRQVSA